MNAADLKRRAHELAMLRGNTSHWDIHEREDLHAILRAVAGGRVEFRGTIRHPLEVLVIEDGNE